MIGLTIEKQVRERERAGAIASGGYIGIYKGGKNLKSFFPEDLEGRGGRRHQNRGKISPEAQNLLVITLTRTGEGEDGKKPTSARRSTLNQARRLKRGRDWRGRTCGGKEGVRG